MSGKQLIVGESRWGVADSDAFEVAKQVQDAMTNGTVAELGLLNEAGQPVKVFFNGKIVATAVIDNSGDPRPSEFS
ncbi:MULTISPECIES: hypothetical protein [Dactylosporangium]|uniref:Uncharacterized protein n=2 Tax=Dactylosporangium TaxID=35753 RepID=A0A9W6NTJ2_9ACTN|nr:MULTISPECIES: hypothetical protein [Dactylosporangium]UAB94507.1 hypothetical protein Dvina_41250 [Dactylosporangium vinaceum]UWZ42879.1 hypothetical protein Dmats_35965 [Dactylosporangium matsuzakiense]GLL08789.1 hypothetical protein GCM10017581_105630 [Dactylosporangium matsuzakiense]